MYQCVAVGAYRCFLDPLERRLKIFHTVIVLRTAMLGLDDRLYGTKTSQKYIDGALPMAAE